jgi:hypothetical protein
MKIDLRAGETLIREGGANLQRGVEAVGGRLFLTDQRIFFQSHAFNVQTGSTEIALTDIRGTALRWTKFLGVLPLFPNTLAVLTQDGIEHRFVVYGRRKWQAAIEAQRHKGA